MDGLAYGSGQKTENLVADHRDVCSVNGTA
jgi:hypothetical protein